jgi:hypothetical protein
MFASDTFDGRVDHLLYGAHPGRQRLRSWTWAG